MSRSMASDLTIEARCPLCVDDLVRAPETDAEIDQHTLCGSAPCPRCLSVAATDEIREVSMDAEGYDKWLGHPLRSEGAVLPFSPWWAPIGGGAAFRMIVPLWLPAGFDLLCHCLAKLLGVSPEAQIGFRAVPGACLTWVFSACEPGEDVKVWYFSTREPHAEDCHPYILVDGIDKIPADVPGRYRAGRAIVLAYKKLAGIED